MSVFKKVEGNGKEKGKLKIKLFLSLAIFIINVLVRVSLTLFVWPRCEVFRAMFSERSASDDMPFVLSDVRPLTFMTMLEFIYTNRCQPSLEFVSETLSFLSTCVCHIVSTGRPSDKKMWHRAVSHLLDNVVASQLVHSVCLVHLSCHAGTAMLAHEVSFEEAHERLFTFSMAIASISDLFLFELMISTEEDLSLLVKADHIQ